MPLNTFFRVPDVPESPECYADAHLERIDDFLEEIELVISPHKPEPDDKRGHELDDDVKSVFWLLLYWAMVAQPEGCPRDYTDSHIDLVSWGSLLGDSDHRGRLVVNLATTPMPKNLTHRMS